ncbi:MAG: hypothetical protein Athens101410_186 [Parcubacteria group bacterium Athens1014_10]|nr:MAG: hypothetical protein Athens101410_186 [Parcubacteria group bacterium Athens1014_10]TSD05550.1 MAG: hypothetical protein Athens071412_251 [Parcubacteria group bacterium Athens0714_12]
MDYKIFLENTRKFLDNKFGQLVFLAVLVFIVFIPFFLGGKIFYHSDMNWGYADLYFSSQAIKTGASFWWNPYILSGFPTFLSGGNCLSFIFYAFFKFFNFLSAYHWLLFLNLVLAAYLMARLLVHFKISSIPALIAGISYISRPMVMGSDLSLIGYLLFLPALIWCLIICYEKNAKWTIFAGALLVYLSLVSVHPNWFFIILVSGFIFALFYPWIKEEQNGGKYFTLFAKYSSMVFFGFLLGLVFIIPLLNNLSYFFRSRGLSYSWAVASSSAQFLDFFNFFLPYFSVPQFTSGAQFYFGVLPLFFAILAFVLYRKQRLVKFFSLVFIVVIIITIKYSPLFWLMQKLPVFNFFRAPDRWLALGLFAGSILAGVGAENFFQPDFKKFRDKLIKIFKWSVALIIIFALIFNLISYFFGDQIIGAAKKYFEENLYSQTTGLPLAHYHSAIEQIYYHFVYLYSFVNPKFIFPLLILLISYLAIKFFSEKERQRNYFYLSALGITALNFLLIMPYSYLTIYRQSFNYQPKIAQRILEEPGKVFSFLPGFSEFNELSTPYQPDLEQVFVFQSEFLVPNLGTLYGIKSADGYNSLMPKRYSEILALIGSDRAVTGEKLSALEIPLAEKIVLFKERLNLVDLLGIKYIISTYQMEDENLEEIFQTEATDYKIPIYLYQNKKNLPEIYFAESVEFLAPGREEENLPLIIKKENDFSQKTFIECAGCSKIKEPLNQTVQIIEEKSGYSKIETSNENAGWLVFSQSDLPGWQVEIDAAKTEIYNADYIFQAVLVPAGDHRVIFKYNPFDVSEILKL